MKKNGCSTNGEVRCFEAVFVCPFENKLRDRFKFEIHGLRNVIRSTLFLSAERVRILDLSLNLSSTEYTMKFFRNFLREKNMKGRRNGKCSHNCVSNCRNPMYRY
jgi:hypothetical protein